MIIYKQGNLFDSQAEALVNTVNTVGVMGKGIALAFKERFQSNYQQYVAACQVHQVQVGSMFVTAPTELGGPKWIVNFPTKEHWRAPSKLSWIEAGLQDLRRFVLNEKIQSIAIPALGAGNGGLDWKVVRTRIEAALGDLPDIHVMVFEPAPQDVVRRAEEAAPALTIPRALVVEMIRQYAIAGEDCTLLEVQKLAWFLDRHVRLLGLSNPLKFNFTAHWYGPYASSLAKLLAALEGTFLLGDRRMADAGPADSIWFDESRNGTVQTYLQREAAIYLPALAATAELIEGFETPYGLELLASIDWLLARQRVEPDVDAILSGLAQWPAEDAPGSGERKRRLFDARSVEIALQRLENSRLHD